ncbi:hypothetical protein [Nonomuraea rubra]|uniref:hypothetical protein n=1 Tax=Nonomuraea rubra TaxID=46180 RepID=UPI0033D2C5F9
MEFAQAAQPVPAPDEVLDQWGEALRAVRRHVARAGQAATAISTGEYRHAAARWFHFATLGPNRQSALAAAEADTAIGRWSCWSRGRAGSRAGLHRLVARPGRCRCDGGGGSGA